MSTITENWYKAVGAIGVIISVAMGGIMYTTNTRAQLDVLDVKQIELDRRQIEADRRYEARQAEAERRFEALQKEMREQFKVMNDKLDRIYERR